MNTFLQAFPGDVATASLNLNTLGLPGFVSASGNNTVHTFGNDILVQQVILNFGDTADTALLLAGVNLDVLSSPSLTSSITLLEPDPVGVPEPGTAALALIGFAAAAAHRRFRRK